MKDKYSIVVPYVLLISLYPVPSSDTFLFPRLRLVLINVFVERLILRMKNVDDPGTQACISTLMFNRPAPGSESDASEDISEVDSEASPLEIPTQSEEKSIV